ncbi:MAG TPA: GH92 family glycosyl hydrolase [Edaphobacter sp.]
MCAASALPLDTFAFAKGTEEDPLRWVDPRIGTGGHGHCFPGAALPFGMVQLSPDTFNNEWDWCSGYHVSDSSIMGFSHTHLSGTGCGDLLDFLVMAGTGDAHIVPGDRSNPDAGYRSRFDHADEVMEPGYYSVLLKDYKVRAELTATERTGFHRYTFPASDKAYLILDLQHGYGPGAGLCDSAELRQLAPDTLAGGRRTSAWGKNRHAYFTLKVSKRPERIVYFIDDKEVAAPTGTEELKGKNVKCVLYFKTKANERILVKTGISGVDAEGAGKNLAAETTSWEFDKVRKDARETWRKQISKIKATSANETHKRIFYTALYHLSLGPTLFDDVDGRYRGMDNEIHSLATGEHHFSTFSLWDTFRAAHPTFTLIEKQRVPLFMNTLIRMSEQSPKGMPVWPLMSTETGTMTGYHSAAVISEACSKGFTGIDYEKAYGLMMKRAMHEDYRGLGYYRTLNYIPADKEEESVSKTFEYCYDDWSIAHVAHKLGKSDDAAMLVKRSGNYRNYYDASTGFMRPKLEDGSWTTPFRPIDMGHTKKWRDYTESNAWQATFGIQHDPAGLIEILGGRESFVKRLDGLFTAPSDLPEDAPPDIAGMVGQYAHGNEPSHHISYLYVYAGAPYKTQARVRSLLETMYADQPNGMQGNEDVGQMSAWYILSALGFYPVDPVSGNYVLGSGLFENAVVELGGGKKLEIVVERKDPAHQYVQAFSLNGKPQQKVWFHHSDIVEGGKLVITMGPEPNTTLGADVAAIPPSLKLA